jgi:hypothetical protein
MVMAEKEKAAPKVREYAKLPDGSLLAVSVWPTKAGQGEVLRAEVISSTPKSNGKAIWTTLAKLALFRGEKGEWRRLK